MPHPQFKYGMLSADMEKGVGGGIVQGDGWKNHFAKDINRAERLYGSFH